MKKILLVVICVLLVVAVGLYAARNVLVKNLLTSSIESMTGLKVSLERINLGIFNNSVSVHNLTLSNPAGFSDSTMVSMPELYVQYDLGAFLKGKVHLKELRLNLKECLLARSKRGELNVQSLAALQPKGQGQAPSFLIDSLDVKIGKIGFKNYSFEPAAQSYEFNANVDEHLEHVDSPQKLINLILTQVLKSGGIAELANIDISAIEQGISKKTKAAGEATAKQTVEDLKKSAEDALKKTGQDYKKLF